MKKVAWEARVKYIKNYIYSRLIFKISVIILNYSFLEKSLTTLLSKTQATQKCIGLETIPKIHETYMDAAIENINIFVFFTFCCREIIVIFSNILRKHLYPPSSFPYFLKSPLPGLII